MGGSSINKTFLQKWGIVIFAVIALAGAGAFLAVHFSSGENLRAERAAEPETFEPETVYGESASRENLRAERAARLETVYEELVGVKAVIDFGVTYLNYGPLLAPAARSVALHKPEDDETRVILSHLEAALDSYQAAYRVWRLEFADFFESLQMWDRLVSDYPELISFGIKDCPFAESVDVIVEYFWSKASRSLSSAELYLRIYREE